MLALIVIPSTNYRKLFKIRRNGCVKNLIEDGKT